MEILVAGALLDGVSFAKYDVVVLGGCHANEWVRMDVCMNGCVLLNLLVGGFSSVLTFFCTSLLLDRYCTALQRIKVNCWLWWCVGFILFYSPKLPTIMNVHDRGRFTFDSSL